MYRCTFPVHHADGCPPALPSATLPESSPTLCCHRPRCWRRLGLGGGYRRDRWGGQVPWTQGLQPAGRGCASRSRAFRQGEQGLRDRGLRGGWAGPGQGGPEPGGPSPSPTLTCHRAQPRLRASAAMNTGRSGPWLPEHRQGQQGLRRWPAAGSGSSIMTKDRTQLQRTACPRAGPRQGWGLAPSPCLATLQQTAPSPSPSTLAP